MRGCYKPALPSRSFLSSFHEPPQAANPTVAIHTNTQVHKPNGGIYCPPQAPENPAYVSFMCPYIAKKGSRILGLDSPVRRHLEPREQCPTKPTYLPTFMLHDLATTHLDDYHRDTHTVSLYGGIDAIAVRTLSRPKVRDPVLGRKL